MLGLQKILSPFDVHIIDVACIGHAVSMSPFCKAEHHSKRLHLAICFMY